MVGPDWLQYGGVGLAGLTMLLSLALCKWVFGKAFEQMEKALSQGDKNLELVAKMAAAMAAAQGSDDD